MRAVIGVALAMLACGRAPAGTAAPVEPGGPGAPVVEGPTPGQAAVNEGAAGDRGEPPRARVDAVKVGPKWSPGVIKRIIRTRMPAIERCHAAAPDAPPVTLRVTIGADGAVSDAEALVEGEAVSSHPAHTCVLAEIRALRFPVDMAGLIVTYPLR